jgi:hypothetical protein
MRSPDTQNQVPKVAADQFALDRTLKHLRKLRWIGREREAKKYSRHWTIRDCSSRFHAIGADGTAPGCSPDDLCDRCQASVIQRRLEQS